MTASANLKALVDEQALSFKNIRASIHNGTANAADVAAALNTAAGTMVGAINELKAGVYTNAMADARVQNAIDDSSTSTTTLYSSAKIAAELAAAVLGSTDELAEGASNQYFTNSRADARVQEAIDDAGTSTSDLWSAAKITSEISTKINELVDGADPALDTLRELAEFADNNAGTIQNLTTLVSQKANAADVFTKSELGADLDSYDFAAQWTSAISA